MHLRWLAPGRRRLTATSCAVLPPHPPSSPLLPLPSLSAHASPRASSPPRPPTLLSTPGGSLGVSTTGRALGSRGLGGDDRSEAPALGAAIECDTGGRAQAGFGATLERLLVITPRERGLAPGRSQQLLGICWHARWPYLLQSSIGRFAVKHARAWAADGHLSYWDFQVLPVLVETQLKT